MADTQMVHLVTGRAPVDHVSSANVGALNAGIVGPGSYVLNYGDNLVATMPTANSITIGTGCVLHNGRQIEVEQPKTLTVQSGTQGQKRNDLVVVRYTLNQDGTEDGRLVVIKGAAAAGTPVDPAYKTGSILGGAPVSDMPLYRIELNGITVGIPVKLFETLVPQKDAWDSVSQRVAHEDVTWTAHIVSTGPEKNLNVLGPKQCTAENYICKRVVRAWATSSWANGAVVSVAHEPAWDSINFTTNQEQDYEMVVRFYYWA